MPDNAVVSVPNGWTYVVEHKTFKVDEFAQRLQACSSNGSISAEQGWFSQGVSCEVLIPSGGEWRKGKIKVSLVFCPDEADATEAVAAVSDINLESVSSPLDELRRTIADH